jgi:hypothetical protein
VNYSAAWAAVAVLVSGRTEPLGPLLQDLARRAPRLPRLPSEAELLAAVRPWTADLAVALGSEDDSRRAAAARVLGRLGETAPLRKAYRAEQPLWVRCAIAGALARNGRKEELREVFPRICCANALSQVSLAAGREFASLEDLERWLAP